MKTTPQPRDLCNMITTTLYRLLQSGLRCMRDVHFLWMEMMQDGTECQTISPGSVEVGDFHPWIPAGDVLTPL